MYKLRTMTNGAQRHAEAEGIDTSIPFFKWNDNDPRLTNVRQGSASMEHRRAPPAVQRPDRRHERRRSATASGRTGLREHRAARPPTRGFGWESRGGGRSRGDRTSRITKTRYGWTTSTSRTGLPSSALTSCCEQEAMPGVCIVGALLHRSRTCTVVGPSRNWNGSSEGRGRTCCGSDWDPETGAIDRRVGRTR